MEERNELSFTEEVVKNLKLESRALSESLKKCREKDNFSMYKNLINAYKEVTRLIQDYDFRLMYSEYKLENGKRQIAIWEQNADGVVRNHKVWNVEGETSNNITINVDIDEEDNPDRMIRSVHGALGISTNGTNDFKTIINADGINPKFLDY